MPKVDRACVAAGSVEFGGERFLEGYRGGYGAVPRTYMSSRKDISVSIGSGGGVTFGHVDSRRREHRGLGVPLGEARGACGAKR